MASVVRHGYRYTRIYSIWKNMKRRCRGVNIPIYKFYGAKGIDYCDKWESFLGFHQDMAEGYADHLTIDRIDNTKGYCKENCRWITQLEQASNKSNNRFLTFKGKTLSLAQWSRETGLHRETLRRRLDVRGWSVEEALGKPRERKRAA